MQERAPAVDKKIVELIEQTMRESMAPFGFKKAEVKPGEDHDGDQVIFVEAQYDLSDTPIDPAVVARLTSILRDRLWNVGETRFPHISHKFDEKQKIRTVGRGRD
jgi:hypothetical protein